MNADQHVPEPTQKYAYKYASLNVNVGGSKNTPAQKVIIVNYLEKKRKK